MTSDVQGASHAGAQPLKSSRGTPRRYVKGGLVALLVAGFAAAVWIADRQNQAVARSQEVRRSLESFDQEYLQAAQAGDISTDSEVIEHAERLVRSIALSNRLSDRDPSADPAGETLRQAAVIARGTLGTGFDAEAMSRTVEALIPGSATAAELAALHRSSAAVAAKSASRILELDAVSREFRRAAHDASLVELTRAEAKLRVMHRGLRNAGVPGLPGEPLALLSESTATEAIRSVQRRVRYLEDRVALLDNAETRMRLDLDRDLVQRLNLALSSEAKAFNEGAARSFEKMASRDWDVLKGSLTTDTTAEVERIVRNEIEARGVKWNTILEHSKSPRGPPSSVDPLFSRLKADVRRITLDYHQSPTDWCRTEARLQSLGDVLIESAEMPDVLRGDPKLAYDRVFALLDAREVEGIREFAEGELERLRNSPESRIFSGERHHIETLFEAGRRETSRRASGGSQVALSSSRRDLYQLVESYTGSDMPRRAEARLLSVIRERFPAADTVPASLTADTTRILKKSVEEYGRKLDRVMDTYLKLSDRLALSTDVADARLIETHSKLKDRAARVRKIFDEHVAAAAANGVDVSFVKRTQRRMTGLLPRPPPDFDPPSAPLPRSPAPTPPNAGGGMQVTQFDLERVAGAGPPTRANPQLEKGIFELQAGMRVMDHQLTTAEQVQRAVPVDFEPPEFGRRPGRRTLAKADLSAPDLRWTDIKSDVSQTRLPERLHDWKGRLQENRKPFDYRSQVKNPRSFKALGGGIHFGEIAQPEPGVDLTAWVLKYDSEHGLHLHNGDTGAVVIIDSKINPITLKALYRFATDKRNAAVSIGWGVERQSLSDILSSQSSGSPILLDPFFVDTRVGQVLITADSIPWEFNEPELPNGHALPSELSSLFGNEVEAYRQRQITGLRKVVRGIEAFSSRSRPQWFRSLNRADVPLLLRAQLYSEDPDAAREWFVSENIRMAMKEEEFDVGDTPSDTYRAFLRKQILDAQDIEFVDLTIEGMRVLANVVEKQIEAVRQEIGKNYDESLTAFDGTDSPLLSTIDLLMLSEMAENGQCERTLVELWVALLRGRKDSEKDDESIAKDLLARINPTTLAYLYDDKVTFRIVDGRLSLSTHARYRYATSHIRVDHQTVGIGRQDDPEQEVEELTALTDLANRHLGKIRSTFEPLDEAIHYAGLTAFLKWAIDARGSGDLLAIDLSALAGHPGHSEELFPTADAILK